MLMATCCEDDIVPHVLPFVKDNIQSPDWRYRDAAVMAFGESTLIAFLSVHFVIIFCLVNFLKACGKKALGKSS